MTQIYIKQNIHKHQTQNFRRISPFGITPVKKAHKARTRWYRGPLRRFINTRERERRQREREGDRDTERESEREDKKRERESDTEREREMPETTPVKRATDVVPSSTVSLLLAEP